MPAMEPTSLLRFLRKLKEVFDVCDEDADGFIRVEHFVALGLQFGQGDEVSEAGPARCLGSRATSPAAPALQGTGNGSAWPDPARTTHLPSALPGFSPASREPPTVPSGWSGLPPSLRASQNPPHGGPEPPSLRATRSPFPAESSLTTARISLFLRGSRSLPHPSGRPRLPGSLGQRTGLPRAQRARRVAVLLGSCIYSGDNKGFVHPD